MIVRNVFRSLYLSSISNSRSMASVIKLNVNDTDTKAAVLKAVSSLQAGNVIAVPTDTIYGVAALAQDISAVKKLYAVKGRNGHNPIAICVSNVQDLFRWSHVTVTQDLLNDLLPGAVTLVFRRKPELNPEFNPFTDLIGIRIPNYPFVQQIAAAAGSPVALTSANISAAKSTLCVEEFENLWPHLDLVFDGGIIGDSEEARLGSTVINLSVPGQFTIIRPGSVYQKTVDILKNKYGLKEVR
ncbi:threonylcarbamoyl-AMP synthase-like [Amphiura filiformis]|uniref:threonylcarbamoyl-AMP synthase-like n=1 Tax=Amphiura filiformis TaxID=82378 RepID=UPI003B220461